MNITPTALPGLSVVDTTPFCDHRGEFSRAFCERELAPAIGERHVVQISLSSTRLAGTVRGLHFQRAPHAEMKLVRCLRGRVWDVAVDLRPASPTFLRWHAEELSAANRRMLVIPEGFAHGFQTLEADCELLYLMTEAYEPGSAAGVRWDDPALAIPWPLPVGDISAQDLALPLAAALRPAPAGSGADGAHR